MKLSIYSLCVTVFFLDPLDAYLIPPSNAATRQSVWNTLPDANRLQRRNVVKRLEQDLTVDVGFDKI